jgi:hypothetical protein
MQLNYILLGELKKFLPFIPSPLMWRAWVGGAGKPFSNSSNTWRTIIKSEKINMLLDQGIPYLLELVSDDNYFEKIVKFRF